MARKAEAALNELAKVETAEAEVAVAKPTPLPTHDLQEPPAKGDNRGPARKVALGVLGMFAVLLAIHILSDQLAPTSSTGSVTAFTALVAPRVAGQVQEVFVKDNELVQAGDPLFAFDPAPFDLIIRQAEANLAQVLQTVDATTASVMASQAKVSQAKANLESTATATERTLKLVERGLVSKAEGDTATAQLISAEATLKAAEADLEGAVLRAGGAGTENAQAQASQVQLEQAQLNRSFATVVAPTDGVVTNLKLAVGQYINAGTAALTFIESEQPWVVVDLRENQLANVDVGDEAGVVFDAAPGRSFKGRVRGIAWGIDPGRTAANGLPQNQSMTRWFEPARTIPVHVELAEGEEWPRNVRVGSKANALIYAGGTGNPVAWIAGTMQAVQSFVSFLY